LKLLPDEDSAAVGEGDEVVVGDELDVGVVCAEALAVERSTYVR